MSAGRRLGRARAGAAVALLAALAVPASTLADTKPRIYAVDDGIRLRREDTGTPPSRGERNPIWKPGAPVHLHTLRDETVAFQVVVETGDVPAGALTVDVEGLAGIGGAPAPRVTRFVEHYTALRARSRSKNPLESLGWTPAARPPDAAVLGTIPDALIPVDVLEARDEHDARWFPYPFDVPAHATGATWIDVFVPRDAAPGAYAGDVVVREHGAEVGRLDVALDVDAAVLPYRPVSFLAYYGPGEIAARVGDREHAEQVLWQLLHAHHVDALGSLESVADVERLRPALDGSLFTPAHGYVGPGEGVPPAAVALGAYGDFGDPTPDAIAKVEAIVPRVPDGVADLFLYAVDEDCDSTLGPDWRRAIAARPELSRVRVGHSCYRDPRAQDVDLVLTPAETFDGRTAAEARAHGKQVWVYNGTMPRSGAPLVDAPFEALRADGWIAATHAVGRWFLWETTFWNDDNRGGRGAIDPFATFESFHNQHGDTSMGDGMLVYPGAQKGAFAAHSLGYRGVLPSMRLKSLRRGIEDAGYFALARAAAPDKADAIARDLVPRALDEAAADEPASFPSDGAAFAHAREELRALIQPGAALADTDVRRVVAAAAVARADMVPQAPRPWSRRRKAALAAVIGSIALLAFWTALRLRGRRRGAPRGLAGA